MTAHPPTQLPTYLDRNHVAKALDVSPDTVTGMVDAGELSAIVIRRGKKRYLRFDPDDLREQLERMRNVRPPRYRPTPRPTSSKDAAPWQSKSAPPRRAPSAGQ